ncbi:MAG: undecaprenyldiphospho-muramoylpentapeptide beta-N-acetylglucosaminyltransferase [Desulfobacterales bacterium]|nr:undecaprenyldiphospho-muramoylpentapeptide beta-N-acetylglucosaminyltransferase [Desulfobacterales bacterium]
MFRCMIAGGGTGGHLFPGIAVARELQDRFENVEILFIVGKKKIESEILSGYGYSVTSIDVEGAIGRGWKKGISVLVKLPKSLLQSASIAKEFSPDLVFGMGGYCAGPVCLAAKFMGIPTAIHEQNSYPGLTNRFLSRFVDIVFISFEESREHFKKEKLILTGNPVRNELFSDHDKRNDDQKDFTVLIIGGSQGAKAINEKFIEALEYLNREGRNPQVIHQTGEQDYGRVVKDYRNRKLSGDVTPFIQDMGAAYKRADLVISRAGATTISELAVLGKPSILIPYPYATNQHQDINARSLVGVGAAKMISQGELDGESIARLMMGYMDDRSSLEEMGRRARKIGSPDAAKLIVDQLKKMTGLRHTESKRFTG